jgi:Sulfotransferase family
MGAGHSGSTILGVALGNCEGFFYAGEVEEWLLKSGNPPWGAADRMRFWDGVAERVGGAEELFGDEANRLIERSSALLRVDRWPARRRMRRSYRRVAEELLLAIAATAGVEHVVDTSHFPLRARELQRLGGIELYLLFLVRDPQAVVASNVRALSQHEVAERRARILVMNANLWLTQLLSVLVFLRQPPARRLLLRHEDFIADPEGVLRRILDGVGSDAALPDLGSLRVGAPLQGNRLIRTDLIKLERSTPATRRWSLFTALAQAPWTPVLRRLSPAARTRREVQHAAPAPSAARSVR